MKSKKPYRIKLLSEQVQSLFSRWHYLQGPFKDWQRIKASRKVRFEGYYTEEKIKRVVTYEKVIVKHKISVVMPPLSNEPLYEYKVYMGKDIQPEDRKRIGLIIKPLIYKFILRNY